MVRNAETTRGEILRAATAEFAEHGIAGARVDRIAQAAGCNKNLLYVYFGNKEQLFQAVISAYGEQLQEAAPFTAKDLEGYATALFDFTLQNPSLIRLTVWIALEGRAMTESGRASYQTKVAAIAEAQAQGLIRDDFRPSVVLSIVNAIATAWTVGTYGSGVRNVAPVEASEQRAAIATSVRTLLVRGSPAGL